MVCKLRWRRSNLHPIQFGKNVFTDLFFRYFVYCPNYLKFNRFFVGASIFLLFFAKPYLYLCLRTISRKKKLFYFYSHRFTTVHLIRKIITSEETGTQLSEIIKNNYFYWSCLDKFPYSINQRAFDVSDRTIYKSLKV